MSERDRRLLERASAEAARAGWLETAPNPRVGALALAGGHVIGRGHHPACGGPHAEEQALRDAGAWDEAADRPRPGIVDEMVVTLQPCSAEGPGKRRPACARLLREAGVRRLLVGARDPDPRHAGARLEDLLGPGAEVRFGPGEETFATLNPAFLAAQARPERPFVLLKWAASLDGKVAAASGASRWITGAAARAEVHELRAASDAVLAGPGTLRADDPELTARPGGAPAPRQPLRVLLLPEADLADGARVGRADGPRLWVVRQGATPSPALARLLAAGDDLLPLPPAADGRLPLAPLLAELRRGRRVRRLFVEGGPRLQGRLLDAGLADAVVCYEAPILLGGPRSALAGEGFPAPAAAVRLGHEERRDLGPDLRRAFLVLPPGEAVA